MANGLTARDWIKKTERATLDRSPKGASKAKAAFRRLSIEEQRALIDEVIETRASEICRAYKNVVRVSSGYKRKGRDGSEATRTIRRLCLKLMVKRKWKAAAEENPEEKLPEHIFAYTTVNNQRTLCAIPTDVNDARDYAAVTDQANRVVAKPEGSATNSRGMITCAIKRSTTGDQIFAISCCHILSISHAFPHRPFFSAKVHLNSGINDRTVCRSISVRGNLVAEPHYSFDAQLGAVDPSEEDALRDSLNGLTFTGFARNFGEIPNKYWIQSHRDKISAEKQGLEIDVGIRYTNVGEVLHEQLIESKADTRKGDSGSPCTSQEHGGLLLGMHIAGGPAGNSIAYMIPAWQLLAPLAYKGATNSETWELLGSP